MRDFYTIPIHCFGHQLTERPISKVVSSHPRPPMPEIPSHVCQQFFNPRFQNINMAPSAKVLVICSDHWLLWQDSYNYVDHTSTSDESILQVYYLFIKLRIFQSSQKWRDVRPSVCQLILLLHQWSQIETRKLACIFPTWMAQKLLNRFFDISLEPVTFKFKVLYLHL